MDHYLPLLIYVMAAVVFLLLAERYGKRFGIKTMAEERAERNRRSEELSQRERAAYDAREAKLATMTEPERERFLSREFRLGALAYAAMWGLGAVGAYYVGTDLKMAAKFPSWLVWGIFGVSALIASGCALCAVLGESGITVILWLIGIAIGAYLIFGINWTLMWVLIVVLAVGFIGVINTIDRQKRRD